MPALTIIVRDGETRTVDASTDLTVMEVIRNAGVDELLALCGGVCSCATCHVHVDPAFFNRLAPMSEDEDALLDSSPHRDAWSRLSCQFRLTDALSGATVTVADQD